MWVWRNEALDQPKVHKIHILKPLNMDFMLYLGQLLCMQRANMKSMTTTEAQKNFGTLVNQAIREPVSITKHTTEVFIILPADHYHKMQKLAALQESKIKKSKSLRDFIGAGRHVSRFSSVEDVDAFIASNRETWKI